MGDHDRETDDEQQGSKRIDSEATLMLRRFVTILKVGYALTLAAEIAGCNDDVCVGVAVNSNPGESCNVTPDGGVNEAPWRNVEGCWDSERVFTTTSELVISPDGPLQTIAGRRQSQLGLPNKSYNILANPVNCGNNPACQAQEVGHVRALQYDTEDQDVANFDFACFVPPYKGSPPDEEIRSQILTSAELCIGNTGLIFVRGDGNLALDPFSGISLLLVAPEATFELLIPHPSLNHDFQGAETVEEYCARNRNGCIEATTVAVDLAFQCLASACSNVSNWQPEPRDSDGDSVENDCDTCPDLENSDDGDSDNDGLGNNCDCESKLPPDDIASRLCAFPQPQEFVPGQLVCDPGQEELRCNRMNISWTEYDGRLLGPVFDPRGTGVPPAPMRPYQLLNEDDFMMAAAARNGRRYEEWICNSVGAQRIMANGALQNNPLFGKVLCSVPGNVGGPSYKTVETTFDLDVVSGTDLPTPPEDRKGRPLPRRLRLTANRDRYPDYVVALPSGNLATADHAILGEAKCYKNPQDWSETPYLYFRAIGFGTQFVDYLSRCRANVDLGQRPRYTVQYHFCRSAPRWTQLILTSAYAVDAMGMSRRGAQYACLPAEATVGGEVNNLGHGQCMRQANAGANMLAACVADEELVDSPMCSNGIALVDAVFQCAVHDPTGDPAQDANLCAGPYYDGCTGAE